MKPPDEQDFAADLLVTLQALNTAANRIGGATRDSRAFAKLSSIGVRLASGQS